MRKTFTLLLLLAGAVAKAQIQAPDTVCVGTPFVATSSDTAQTYAFSPTATAPVYSVGSAHIVNIGNQVQIGASAPMVNDNGNYYGFVVSADYHLFRLNFGSNPNATPAVTDLGNPGNLFYFFPQGMEIIKDGTQWYGFIMDGSTMIRLSFGTSLTNTPTAIAFDLTTSFTWYAMQISIKKYKGEWIGFIGAFGETRMCRVEFGTSLTNTPTAYNLPLRSNPYTPCHFTLHDQNGEWYMLVTDLTSNLLVRYDFGTNLKNNTPVYNNLGDLGGKLSLPRGISIQRDCSGFKCLVMNEGGDLLQLDFANNITNTPTATSLGTLGAPSQMEELNPYWYNNTLYMMTVNFSTPSTVIQFPVLSLANSQYSYNPSFTYAYGTAGTYQLSMMSDMGDPRGGHALCKTIVAVDTIAITITAKGDTLSVPAGYPSYQWYLNGVAIDATGPEIIAGKSGVYTVVIVNAGGCPVSVKDYLHFATGIDAMNAIQAVQVYPNPATDNANLDLSKLNGHVEVELYNVIGMKVQQYQAEGGKKLQIDLSQLQRGMYNVKISNNKQSITKQISLQ